MSHLTPPTPDGEMKGVMEGGREEGEEEEEGVVDVGRALPPSLPPDICYHSSTKKRGGREVGGECIQHISHGRCH